MNTRSQVSRPVKYHHGGTEIGPRGGCHADHDGPPRLVFEAFTKAELLSVGGCRSR